MDILAWMFFSVIGQIFLLYLLLDVIINIVQVIRGFLLPFFIKTDAQSFTTKFGNWAVVTGSTDGIGRAYAFELARRNVNIVLISRTESKLIKTASEIESKYDVKTKIVVADFSNTGSEVYQRIYEEIKDIPVGILVNNVGMNYPYPTYVDELPETILRDVMNINVGATTLMTRLVLPKMLGAGRGAIVNVSSGAELQPLPLMSVYAATKAYIRSFTEALRWEYESRGITVQTLSPMFVNTKMNAFSEQLQHDSIMVPSVETYAKHAVDTLGKIDHTTGYWSHGLQYYFMSLSPSRVRTHIGGYLNKSFRREYITKHKIDLIKAEPIVTKL